jgi:hypothetical protein
MRGKRAKQIRKFALKVAKSTDQKFVNHVYQFITPQGEEFNRTTIKHSGFRRLYQDLKKGWIEKLIEKF